MVSDPFLVGVFFGFVPSMGFLYILLHEYEGLFSERRAFFAYFMGFGGGLVATLLQIVLGPRGNEGQGLAVAEFGLFGLLQSLIFAMVLNSKRFRGRRDTPFYGVAFGLGFGGLNVLFLIGRVVVILAARPGSVLVEAVSLALIGLYFVGSILLHASVGAWIGRGTATRHLVVPMVWATTAESLYMGASYLLFVDPWGTWVPPVAVSLTIALIAVVLRRELDPLVPPEIRREMELHQRRIARERMLAEDRSSGTDPAEARTPAASDEATPRRGRDSS